LAANKRPSTTKKTDRPLIRSSHGGSAAPRPSRATPARPGAARRTRGALPKAPAPPDVDASATSASRTVDAKGREPAEGKPSARSGPRSARAQDLKKGRTAALGAVSSASDEARETAITVAVAAIEKKASGLEVLDVAGKVDYADFLVLMSGRSDRHVTALANAIEEALRKKNKRALAVEGLPHANWVLMDFGDVVVHVFQDDARAAYDIEGLWMDARRIPVPLSEPRDQS
jgi:ribosome-associated protein